VLNQIGVSANAIGYGTWGSTNPASGVFANQFVPWDASDKSTRSNWFDTPFNPTKHILFFTSWQANDPLVHYTIGDVGAAAQTNRVQFDTNSANAFGGLA